MEPNQGTPDEEGARIPVVEGEWLGRKVEFRADRIVVGIKGPSDVVASDAGKAICDAIAETLPNGKVVRYPKRARVAVFQVPEGSDIPTLAKRIAERDDVRYAEPDFLGRPGLLPNDPSFGDQWGLQMIDAEGAWDLETGKPGILIGIIDTGIPLDESTGALNHPDLEDATRFIFGTNFVNADDPPRDTHGHGTHVTGTAAAQTDNAIGIAGMNWHSRVYICRIAYSQVPASDVLAAVEEILDYALNNNLRAVINLSYTFPPQTSNQLLDACQLVHDSGMILCVITGNESSSSVPLPAVYSANFAGVIAVGSTDQDDTVSDFSNTGPEVTVVAPGRDILSAMPPYSVQMNRLWDLPQDYAEGWGTSAAAPHVTGLASLVWSREPRLSNEQVRDVLINTAVKLGPGSFDDAWGNGRVDAAQAVLKAGWLVDIDPDTLSLHFVDVPEGETRRLAVKFTVNSFHATTFEIVGDSPDGFEVLGTLVPLGKSTDYDTPREAYFWISYTGTTDGAEAVGSLTIRCVQTEQPWEISLSATTISRPSACIMLVLDQSGSMALGSGVQENRRIDVLRYSANILADTLREGNGMGIVSFDDDAHDVLIPVVGPVGPADDPNDEHREAIRDAIENFDLNLMGNTSIGDGIERAHERLGDVSSYDSEAILVLTDGHENRDKLISVVQEEGLIDDRLYAVGLGTADVIQPNALNEITNGNGGYTVLTDALDDDDEFKLAKYFLQIQAGVNNEQIVTDPTGRIAPGPEIRIPFRLNEADMSSDVILMLPSQGIVQLALEAPNRSMVTPTTALTSPAVTHKEGRNVSFYRLSLPLSLRDNTEADERPWHAILKVRKEYFSRYVEKLTKKQPELVSRVKKHGVLYTLLVHAYSNLRMRGTLTQTSYEPGATLNLTAMLTEYGAPLTGDVSVRALLTLPNGVEETLILNKTAPGTFSASTVAAHSGIYEFRLIADGFSARRSRFTREQRLTGFVWRGGDQPERPIEFTDDLGEAIDGAVCRLLQCLNKTISAELRKKWLERGIDIDALVKCFCGPYKSRAGSSAVLQHVDPNVLDLLSAALKIAGNNSGTLG